MSRYDLDSPHGYPYDQDEELRRAIEASLRESNTPSPDTNRNNDRYPSPPSVSARLRRSYGPRIPQEVEEADELALALRLSIEEAERQKQNIKSEAKPEAMNNLVKSNEATKNSQNAGVVPDVRDDNKEESPEELRERIRQSWLRWGDKKNGVNNDAEDRMDVNGTDGPTNKTTTIYLSSSDEEGDEEEGLVRQGRRRKQTSPQGLRKDKMDEDSDRAEGQAAWKFPQEEEEEAPPDNDPTTLTDEAIACQLQEAAMRGEDDAIILNESKDEDKELEKQLREMQEREDALMAQQMQRQMEQEADIIEEASYRPRHRRNSTELSSAPFGYGNDWGASPVLERFTRTSTTPFGGTVVTTTTRSTSGGRSVHELIESRRNEADRRASSLFDMLEGLSIPPPVQGESLSRFHGIPLNYLRDHFDSDESDSEDDIEGMSYEDLLNLPTVERGVENLNMYPIVKYSKTDTSSPSCSVCLENYEEGEELRVLSCFHKFHKLCIDTWLKSHKTCPFCKHDLSS